MTERTRLRDSRQDGCCFRRGPVGLLSAYCAILKGASEVYVVDNIPERLEKAEELGAPPPPLIQRRRSRGEDFQLRKKNKGIQQGFALEKKK